MFSVARRHVTAFLEKVGGEGGLDLGVNGKEMLGVGGVTLILGLVTA